MSKKLRLKVGCILAGIAVVMITADITWSKNMNVYSLQVPTVMQSVLFDTFYYGAGVCTLISSVMISTGILYDWIRKTSSVIYRWCALGCLSLAILFLIFIIMNILDVLVEGVPF